MENVAEFAEFAAFVRLHSTALLRSALLLTGDAAAAEDLVQDTFVRLFPRWSRVTEADVPLAYVRRSMTNNFLNGRRRASREVLLADPPERSYDTDLAGPISDRQLVRGMLAGLPPKQRAVLVLRFFHDLSDAEIAADLGCRQGTVRSIVSRALAELRARSDQSSRPPSQPRDTPQTNGHMR